MPFTVQKHPPGCFSLFSVPFNVPFHKIFFSHVNGSGLLSGEVADSFYKLLCKPGAEFKAHSRAKKDSLTKPD